MKLLKDFTDGLAILLAVLLLIYCCTLYVKYKPDETKLEEGKTKIGLFIETSQSNRDMLQLTFFLLLSAAAGICLRKRPEFGIVFACIALSYVLLLREGKSIPKYPNVVVILAVCHAAGAIVYAAADDRTTGKLSCARGGILTAAGALVFSTVSNVYQAIFLKSAEDAAVLKEAHLEIPAKFRQIPELVRLARLEFEDGNTSSATDIVFELGRDVKATGLKLSFLNSIDEEQFSSYLRLSVLLFASVILCIALCRRFRLISAAVAALPFVYSAVQLQRDMLSALSLPILVFTLTSALCMAASFEQNGLIPVEETERQMNAEDEEAENAPPDADPAGLSGKDSTEDTSDNNSRSKDDSEEEIYYT